MSEDTAIRAKAVSQLVERYSLFDDRILIIGCGNGAELYAIRQSGRRQLTVLEDDPETAFRMQRLWPEFERPIDFQLGNLDDLLGSLPTNHFPLVLVHNRQPDPSLVLKCCENIIVDIGNGLQYFPTYKNIRLIEFDNILLGFKVKILQKLKRN